MATRKQQRAYPRMNVRKDGSWERWYSLADVDVGSKQQLRIIAGMRDSGMLPLTLPDDVCESFIPNTRPPFVVVHCTRHYEPRVGRRRKFEIGVRAQIVFDAAQVTRAGATTLGIGDRLAHCFALAFARHAAANEGSPIYQRYDVEAMRHLNDDLVPPPMPVMMVQSWSSREHERRIAAGWTVPVREEGTDASAS